MTAGIATGNKVRFCRWLPVNPGLFRAYADVALLEATLAIIGNPGLAGLEIGDEAIQGVGIVSSRAIAAEKAERAGNVAVPEPSGQPAAQGRSFGWVKANPSAVRPALVEEVVPIQDHLSVG